jgi:hypothetical protein
MFFFMSVAGFLSLAATIVVTSFLLGRSKTAGKDEYGHNEQR